LVDFSKILKGFQTGVTIGQRQARIAEQRKLRELRQQEQEAEKKRKADEAASKTRAELRQELLKRSFTAVEKSNKEQVEKQKALQQEETKQAKLDEVKNKAATKDKTKAFNRQLLTDLQSGLKAAGFDAFSSRKTPVFSTFSNKAQGTTEEATTEDSSNLSDEQLNQKIFESLQESPKKTTKKTTGKRSIEKIQTGEKFLEDAVTKAIKSGKISDAAELSSDDAYDILLKGATKDLSEADVSKGRELARSIHGNILQKLKGMPSDQPAKLKEIPSSQLKQVTQEPFDSRVLINTNLAEEAFAHNKELSQRPLTAHAAGVLNTLKERQSLPSTILDPILAVADNMNRSSSKQGLLSVYKSLVNELIKEGLQPEAQAVNDLIDEID
jgi:hypothetical protein